MYTSKHLTLTIITIIFILFTINITELQYRFNLFKLYENVNQNKIHYSRNNLRHSINEYLDIIQKQILQKINENNHNNILFDENWSGYNMDEIES
jgi:hypothetical protein